MGKRIIFDIGHPAQVHNFKFVYKELINSGWNGFFTLKNKEVAKRLLDLENIPYKELRANKKGKIGKFELDIDTEFPKPSPAEKAVAKSNRDEIRTLLNPIVEAHKDELDSIKMELKPVYDAAKQHATNQKETNVKSEMRKNKDYSKKGHKTTHINHFAYRFLLLKK